MSAADADNETSEGFILKMCYTLAHEIISSKALNFLNLFVLCKSFLNKNCMDSFQVLSSEKLKGSLARRENVNYFARYELT